MTRQNRWNFDTTYATGDILYASTTSELAKLNIGADGKVLTVVSGLPSWEDSQGGGVNSLNLLYEEDFISLGSMGSNGIGNNVSGSGAVITQIVGTATHPGLLQPSTGTTSSGVAELASCFNPTNTPGKGFLFGAGTYTLNWIMQIPTLSTGTQRFIIRAGYRDVGSTTGTLNNGCWFEYVDNVNSGNWQIICRKAGTSTTNNTSTAADTNYNKFTIIVNADATSVTFKINDVEVANSPISTNIPNTTGQECGAIFSIVKTVGGTARTFNFDWYSHYVQLTGARN